VNDKSPLVIAVSGVKNSGKTTLLTKIVPLLRDRGLRVAVIKHDSHEFQPDIPGTDSFRLREAGANAVAVYSGTRYMLVREREQASVEELLSFLRDMDLVLLEGMKHSAYPKIEIVREAVSQKPVCDPATLLALCTDTSAKLEGIPTLGLEAYREITERILQIYAEKQSSFIPTTG